jgi:hypothetical protein
MRMAMSEWIPFNWSYGMTMRRGRMVSQIASRLSLVGFPLRGGKVLQAFLKRCVIVSGFILVDSCGEQLANKGSIFLGKRSRTGAVEDCNDDNQNNSVGKCKLRVLGSFGDLSKSVGSCDGNSGSGSLMGIKFELDFYCREQQNGPKMVADESRYEEEHYWW